MCNECRDNILKDLEDPRFDIPRSILMEAAYSIHAIDIPMGKDFQKYVDGWLEIFRKELMEPYFARL